MSHDLQYILQQLEGRVSQEALLAYLGGHSTQAEREQVEEAMVENPFLADAIEGLRIVAQPTSINSTLQELNAGLRSRLTRTPTRRKKVFQQRWTLAAIVLVVVLAIAAWFLIHFLSGK